jgi:hypothetical protein
MEGRVISYETRSEKEVEKEDQEENEANTLDSIIGDVK